MKDINPGHQVRHKVRHKCPELINNVTGASLIVKLFYYLLHYCFIYLLRFVFLSVNIIVLCVLCVWGGRGTQTERQEEKDRKTRDTDRQKRKEKRKQLKRLFRKQSRVVSDTAASVYKPTAQLDKREKRLNPLQPLNIGALTLVC